jgi:hypothetical protein
MWAVDRSAHAPVLMFGLPGLGCWSVVLCSPSTPRPVTGCASLACGACRPASQGTSGRQRLAALLLPAGTVLLLLLLLLRGRPVQKKQCQRQVQHAFCVIWLSRKYASTAAARRHCGIAAARHAVRRFTVCCR